MAEISRYLPIYKQLEGGLSKDTYDFAAKYPCPQTWGGQDGYHTSSGITWQTWVSVMGTDVQTTERWFLMSDADLMMMLKPLYWDKIQGDHIKSDKIAMEICDWLVNSGKAGEIDTQKLLSALFNDHLTIDGVFGSLTVAAINSAPEADLLQDIINKRIQFFKDIVANNPSQQHFLDGWLSRIGKLSEYIETLT